MTDTSRDKADAVSAMMKIAEEKDSGSAACLARLLASNLMDDFNEFFEAERARPNSNALDVVHGICLGMGLMLGFTVDEALISDTPKDARDEIVDRRVEAIGDMAKLALMASRDMENEDDG